MLPSADILARCQFTGDAQRITLSTTPSAATAVTEGIYLLYSGDAASDMRFKCGAGAVAVTSTTGTPLSPRTYFGPVYFDGISGSVTHISVVAGSGTPVFELIPVK